MIKFILSSLLLLLLLGTVSSDLAAFKVVSHGKGYKTSTELRGHYSQQDSQVGGYHQTEVYFKTKVHSLNPDQAGVSKIDCKDDKITLSLNDGNEIRQINRWPNKVMLLISHKWKCFGKTTTQFFMVKDKTVDSFDKKVTFTVEECDIAEWAEDFHLDISWVDGNTTRQIARDSLDKRLHIPTVDIKDKTISLNVLFDEETGKTSKPDITLLKHKLFCANCFVNGEAKLTLKLAGKINRHLDVDITDAFISINGNVKFNLDLAAKVGIGNEHVNFELENVPFPDLGVPNVFSIGPFIELAASSDFASNAGVTFNFGGEVAFPHFDLKANFVGDPEFEHSGFTPEIKSHGFKTEVAADTADLDGSLKPRLAFGIDVLKGKFTQQVGFGFVTGLGAKFSVGEKSECEGRKPRVKTALHSDVGFFANRKSFPIFTPPEMTLLNECA